MLRPVSVHRALRTAVPRASFTTTLRVGAAGDTGAPPKTGGQGDAFQRRERANEDFAVRQRELEKLKLLKQKLEQQKAQLKEISDHIDDITASTGKE